MEVKDDIAYMQDTDGNSYTIPLEDIDSVSIYSYKHLKAALSSGKNRFTLKYIKRETRGKHSISSIEEIPISRNDYEELEYYLVPIKSIRDLPDRNILNACKI